MKRLLAPFLIPLLIFSSFAGQFATGYADSDELISMGYLWGVAHPSGYPMAVTIVGIWIRLLSFLNPAHAANLLASTLQALTVFIIYQIILTILNRKLDKKDKKNRLITKAIALISSYILAFSALYWLYAGVIEVVSFTNFLIALTIYSAIKWYLTAVSQKKSSKWFFLTWILVGLGLSHIHTFILITPGLLLLLVKGLKHTNSSLLDISKRLLKGLVVLAISFLIPTIILFLFNYQQPTASWYFPPTIPGIKNFILRKDYTGFFVEEAKERSSYIDLVNNRFFTSQPHYLRFLNEHFGTIALLLAILGVFFIIKKRDYIGYFFVISFIISGPLLSGVMGIPNPLERGTDTALLIGVLQRQLLISELMLTILIAYGLWQIATTFQDKFGHKIYPHVFLYGTMVLYITFLISQNTLMANQSKNNIISSYAKHLLETAEKDSAIICTGDTSCFSLLYLSLVEKIRPDVDIFTKNALYRHWYLTKNPEKFPYLYDENPDFFSSLLAWNISRRTTYITLPSSYYTEYIGFEGNPFYLLPHGLLFEIKPKSSVANADISNSAFAQLLLNETASSKDYFKTGLNSYFSGIYNIQGLLHAQIDQQDEAFANLELAYTIDPDNPLPIKWLQELSRGSLSAQLQEHLSFEEYISQANQALKTGDLNLVFNLARKAGYLNPGDPQPHLLISSIMELSGHFDRAKKEAHQALIFDPQNQQAKETILRLN